MSNNQPSFGERCEILRSAADELKAPAEVVALDAIRMAAAQRQFEERATKGKKADR